MTLLVIINTLLVCYLEIKKTVKRFQLDFHSGLGILLGGATVRLCQNPKDAPIFMKWQMKNDENRRKQWYSGLSLQSP